MWKKLIFNNVMQEELQRTEEEEFVYVSTNLFLASVLLSSWSS